MGKWWLAASSRQCAHSCITSCAKFFGKTSNHPGDSTPLQPRFDTLWLLAFPKTKITFEKGRDFRPLMRFRKLRQGSWWQLGELYEVPRCLLWRGLRLHCPVYNVSCIFFNKCLYFSYYIAGYFLGRSCIYTYSVCTNYIIHIIHMHTHMYIFIKMSFFGVWEEEFFQIPWYP